MANGDRPTTDVKNVSLEPKAKRRSFQAAVKTLGERLATKQAELEEARKRSDAVDTALGVIAAEYHALQDAYDLVKPQPRTRKGTK